MTSVLEKLKALDAQRAELLEDAKKEALDKAEKAVAELNELGRDLPCPICKFKTTPHHDGRMHRSQKSKKPFTVEELMEKGLTKVG